ncbi:Coenzyme F420 hydrogenase/dehydrogenase, beta subunit C-terminal domain [Methanosphaera cuniculi]|uniref:Hydrogenase n=1 Tax=Methanosphaera cuniculi TaxID=1077256 RepID=A0A2A2HEG3_9EURY|nr:Coenzyme F420 hydrogenase/dehydrogenase, beta subunit C-terminal domain [Methanosphaera cuniculi]PAV07718.1 hydrogenase [Methanosphaera cuniculi]PWL08939.1 coenzyme F420-reducing hydrogenase subunit beta [Methanosphaera cuniculi]
MSISDEKVAIISTPCQIQAAAKIQKFLDTPIKLKIGLFCMENFSYSYFKEHLKKYNIDYDSIKKFRIEKGHAFITLDDDSITKIPLGELKSVVRKNCHICMDLTSQNADISVGSIGSDDNYSTVIIRNLDAQHIIDDAIKQNYFTSKPLTQKQIGILNKLSQKKKHDNQENIEDHELRSKPVLYTREISDNEILSQNMESNFTDLKDNVIDVGACVLCGACEYLCPDNLIIIDDTKPRKQGKCRDDCHMCFTFCPRTYTPEDLKVDCDDMGNYLNIMTLKSNDNYITQDGGVITTLIKYLLDHDIITKAMVVDKKDDNAWKPYAKLTDDMDEIIKSAGSKYSVCPVFKALGED